MQRVKKGDTVQVIAGKDLGERGEVLTMLNKKERLTVKGVNILKRHRKARQAGNQQIPAQIVEFEGSIHMSNVLVVCPSCDKPTRVGFRFLDDGRKVRFCKKCDSNIDRL